MAKATPPASLLLISRIMLAKTFLRLRLARRIEDKAHSAAGHASQHPETPEGIAEGRTHLPDERSLYKDCWPRE